MAVRRTHIAILVTSFFCAGWLVSCVTKKPPVTPLPDLVESQQAKPAKASTKGAKKLQKELTVTQSEMEPKVAQIKAPTFTISAQDVEVKTILLSLAKEIKQNITIDPTITQKATIDLKNVTLIEALDNILKPLHLRYEVDKSFIHVIQDQMQTRIFRLNYVLSKRSGSSNVSASSGTSGGGGGSSTITASSTTGGTSGAGSSTGQQRTSSSIVTSEETDLWREIITGLQQIIVASATTTTTTTGTTSAASITSVTGSPGGCVSNPPPPPPSVPNQVPGQTAAPAPIPLSPASILSGQTAPDTSQPPAPNPPQGANQPPPQRPFVSINCQAGIIFVKHYPDVLLSMAELLEAIEGSAQRQVFIQAKIIEVTLNKSHTLGIDWSKVTPISIIRNTAVPGGSSGASSSTSTTSSTTPGALTLPGSLTAPFPTPTGTTGVFGTMVMGAAGLGLGPYAGNVNLVIDALQDQGDVSVLSSPKIATLNNQRAVIKVGTEDVFFVPETAAVQGATTTNFSPRTVTIGIVLDVLPQIDANGMVMMSINTSISEKSADRISPDGRISVPVLDVRESNNVVLAKSGQTIVIGGLMKNKLSKLKNGVPLLGDIPLLGRAFQHDADLDQKTELVIMLTPEVMAGLEVDDQVKESQTALKKFGYPTDVDPRISRK